ncbi:hypothetical protein ACET8Y_04010 [Aeromonas veronii]
MSRGGVRAGAGRPKGETTTMVRVPDGCLQAVRSLISDYKHGVINEPFSYDWHHIDVLSPVCFDDPLSSFVVVRRPSRSRNFFDPNFDVFVFTISQFLKDLKFFPHSYWAYIPSIPLSYTP